MPKTSVSKSEPQSKPDMGKAQPTRNSTSLKRTPDLEIAFGQRIRAARISAGMNQTELGVAIGVSFQQVQKYEKGTDRIAASTLQTIAAVLGVHPGSFYDDALMPACSIPAIKAAFEAAGALQNIRDPRIRRHLLALARTLAERELGAENGSGTEQPASTNDEPG